MWKQFVAQLMRAVAEMVLNDPDVQRIVRKGVRRAGSWLADRMRRWIGDSEPAVA